MSDDAIVGDWLHAARTRAGLSLRDLAARADNLVSAQAIGKYERAEMRPAPRVLTALSAALGVSEAYLRGEAGVRLEGVEFRKNREFGRRAERTIKARVLAAVERYLEIEDLVGVAGLAGMVAPSLKIPVRSLEEAEGAATRLRAAWTLGSDPIPHIAEVLEERGVKVIALTLPDSVSGIACRARRIQGADISVIVVSKGDTGERQRLTLAHELGHLVLTTADKAMEEKAAFRFGSALLMPAEIMWAEVGHRRRAVSLGELLQLKRRFGVSVQAIAYRCKDLGITGPAAYRQMFESFDRLGWSRPPYPEAHAMTKVDPQRFKRLCFRALAEGIVSETTAADLLDMDIAQLRRAMQGRSARVVDARPVPDTSESLRS